MAFKAELISLASCEGLYQWRPPDAVDSGFGCTHWLKAQALCPSIITTPHNARLTAGGGGGWEGVMSNSYLKRRIVSVRNVTSVPFKATLCEWSGPKVTEARCNGRDGHRCLVCDAAVELVTER